MRRVLTVDIGNSNIVVGVWESGIIVRKGRIVTKRDYSACELLNKFKEMLGENGESFDGSILSSVVPEITDKTLTVLEDITCEKPLFMGDVFYTGIDVSAYKEGKLGTDRIVDLAAAKAMYPGKPVMVCDLGTCTTISVADKTGKLIGGMICAGVQLSLDAQAQRASQLPQLYANDAQSLLGKDTASNMNSGAIAGTGIMISGIADRVEKEYGLDDLKLVVTGGLGKFVVPWISREVKYDPDLLLMGLYSIYETQQEKEQIA